MRRKLEFGVTHRSRSHHSELVDPNSPMPVFIDNGNGSGTFDFTPDYTQAGVYNVTFVRRRDSDRFRDCCHHLTDVNRPPVLDPIGPRAVNEAPTSISSSRPTMPTAPIPVLTTSTLPTHATFVNNGNGTGTFDFNPDFTQSESTMSRSMPTRHGDRLRGGPNYGHRGGNQPPVLAPIGRK